MQPVKIRTGNHLNRLHDFEGSVNRWPLMRCIQTEIRRSDFFCLSVKCGASFTLWQLPKSLTTTNWPILRTSASIYVMSIVVIFDAKNWLESTAIKPLSLTPQKCWKLHSLSTKFQKFPGKHAPGPPRYSLLRRAFISWRTLPFKLTVSTLYRGSCFRVCKC